MAKNFDIGEYSIEVSRFGNQAESTFSWTVYTAGQTVASGRAEGPHEAEQYARAVVDNLLGIEPLFGTVIETASVCELTIDRVMLVRGDQPASWIDSAITPTSVFEGTYLTRWQRIKAWFKGKIEDARLRIRYQLW